MKHSNIIIYTILVISCIFLQPAKGQSLAKESKDPRLYNVIAHMDSIMFNAFNTQNLNVLKNIFAENLEFYHDRGGLTDYKTNMEAFESNFKQSAPNYLRRELVKGSMEVYPIPGYGAVEMGIHRFIHTEKGKQVIGIYKFTHIWQYKDNIWKVTRVVSVGH